jgi:hypothetical protein
MHIASKRAFLSCCSTLAVKINEVGPSGKEHIREIGARCKDGCIQCNLGFGSLLPAVAHRKSCNQRSNKNTVHDHPCGCASRSTNVAMMPPSGLPSRGSWGLEASAVVDKAEACNPRLFLLSPIALLDAGDQSNCVLLIADLTVACAVGHASHALARRQRLRAQRTAGQKVN